MKLFSRTSLVAFGTAAAVAASALTAPAFAQDSVATPPAVVVMAAEVDEDTSVETPIVGSNNSSDEDMDNIADWIKIVTAVIGALTTVLTFAGNLDRFLTR